MTLRSSRFSPRLLELDVLEQQTVAREPLLMRVIGSLSAAIASGQGRFELLVGPRGVGKSHMLGLVEGRVRAREELRERLVVVSLPEEFSPSSLLHLLARVLEGLPEDPSKPPVSVQLRALRGRETSEALDMVVAMIRARLDGRSLLMMFENLDTLFRDVGRKAQAQLRKIVQSEQGWSIFATARSSVALTKQTEPFHGTFVVEQLEPLTPAQCREMMVRLALVHARPELERWLQTEDGLTQVRAAYLLIGGNPRVVAMLFHHLDPARVDDFEGNFYRLAEELTPYFQEQMAQLSAGQRPVMEFLAERWAPASVTEIAEATFNEPTTVSTHLRALRRDRLVHSIAVGKERFYEIAEPLHRVARAMKQQRRLGTAIAQMARVWALLGEKPESVDISQRWLRMHSDDKSDYVATLIRVIGLADHVDAVIESHIEALAQHAHGHSMQWALCWHLLHLGRDADALVHIESLDAAGEYLELTTAYLLWLAHAEEAHQNPLSQRRLSQIVSNAEIPPGFLDSLFGTLGPAASPMLCRAASHLGDRLAVILPATPGKVPDLGLLLAALVVWVRGRLDQFMEHEVVALLMASATVKAQAEPGSNAHLALSMLDECKALDDILVNPACMNLETLSGTLSSLGACLPLWIASGRDGAALLRALRAKQLELPSTVEDVLAAGDTPRAFARLGAEARAFAREFLRSFQLDDLLAALPAEPIADPV